MTARKDQKIYCPSALVDNTILSKINYGGHINNIHAQAAQEAEEVDSESEEDEDMVNRQFANMAAAGEEDAYSDF